MTQKTDGMERYVIEQAWSSRDILLEKGDVIVMLGEGGWPHTQQVYYYSIIFSWKSLIMINFRFW